MKLPAWLPAPLRRQIERLAALPPVQLVVRLAAATSEHDVAGVAAEMAYRFLFALFPFFIFLAALVGFVGGAIGQDDLFDTIIGLVAVLAPVEIQRVLNDWIAAVVSTQSASGLTLGAVGALWGAAGGVGSLIKGLNRAYGVAETRSWAKVQAIALLTTVLLAFVMTVGAVLYLFGGWLGPQLAAVFGLGDAFVQMWDLAIGPAVAVGFVVILVLLYALLPNRNLPPRRAVPGAIGATAGWVALTSGFSLYVSRFGSYDRTFGSLGAAVVLMVWMYAVGMILLLGGEINAVLESGSLTSQRDQVAAGAGAGTAGQTQVSPANAGQAA